jgi:hypothetical protein
MVPMGRLMQPGRLSGYVAPHPDPPRHRQFTCQRNRGIGVVNFPVLRIFAHLVIIRRTCGHAAEAGRRSPEPMLATAVALKITGWPRAGWRRRGRRTMRYADTRPERRGTKHRTGRWAIGSAGERLVHTEEVTGSIPVSPTALELVSGSRQASPTSGVRPLANLGQIMSRRLRLVAVSAGRGRGNGLEAVAAAGGPGGLRPEAQARFRAAGRTQPIAFCAPGIVRGQRQNHRQASDDLPRASRATVAISRPRARGA